MKKADKNKLKKHYQKVRDDLFHVLQQQQDIEIDAEGDAVDEIQGKSLARIQQKLSERDLIKLRKIDAALEKMAHSSFGKCAECSEEISMKRLETIPGVTLCIGCAEDLEHRR